MGTSRGAAVTHLPHHLLLGPEFLGMLLTVCLQHSDAVVENDGGKDGVSAVDESVCDLLLSV